MDILHAAASQVAHCPAGCPQVVRTNLLRPSLSKEHQQILQALPTCITHGYAFHSMLSIRFLFSDRCVTISLLL